MKVWINDKPITLKSSQRITLIGLFVEYSIVSEGCAIAINGVILRQHQWEETVLSEGDQISLFQAIAGG